MSFDFSELTTRQLKILAEDMAELGRRHLAERDRVLFQADEAARLLVEKSQAALQAREGIEAEIESRRQSQEARG